MNILVALSVFLELLMFILVLFWFQSLNRIKLHIKISIFLLENLFQIVLIINKCDVIS